ncbi:MAG: hypothetical protein ACLQU1_02385 [Bryobacteraceae bacterium]
MKKLISLMIGLGLVLGVTAAVFGQDTKTGTSTKKTSKKKKAETTKKDGGSTN